MRQSVQNNDLIIFITSTASAILLIIFSLRSFKKNELNVFGIEKMNEIIKKNLWPLNSSIVNERVKKMSALNDDDNDKNIIKKKNNQIKQFQFYLSVIPCIAFDDQKCK